MHDPEPRSSTPLPSAATLLGLVFLLASILAAPSAHAQDCVSSPSGRFSFSVSVSPRAGHVPVYDIHVFSGASCEPSASLGATTLGSVRRLAITDGGVLVRILAPRTSHRDWNIVSLVVVARADVAERVLWLTLDDLPGTEALTGSVGALFVGSDLVLRGHGGEARVPFSALDALAGAGG